MDRPTEMRIFVAVVKFRSFTRAANRLGISTSSVSRANADLETRSRAGLFHCTTRRVCMTDKVHAIYEYCESILAQIEAAELRLNSDMNQLAGILRLVVHPAVVASDLPRILCGYKTWAPQVGVEITVRDTRTDIVAGGYDVGILPPRLIANTRALSRSVRTSLRILVSLRHISFRTVAPG